MALEARWTTWFKGGRDAAVQVVSDLLADDVVLEQITSWQREALEHLRDAVTRARYAGQVGTVRPDDVLLSLTMDDVVDLDALLLDQLVAANRLLPQDRVHELRDRLPLPQTGREPAVDPRRKIEVTSLGGSYTEEITDDPVNHPSHYRGFSNGAEVIDIVENLPYNRGAAVKYLARAGRKAIADELEDLRKAAWYINREIERTTR